MQSFKLAKLPSIIKTAAHQQKKIPPERQLLFVLFQIAICDNCMFEHHFHEIEEQI